MDLQNAKPCETFLRFASIKLATPLRAAVLSRDDSILSLSDIFSNFKFCNDTHIVLSAASIYGISTASFCQASDSLEMGVSKSRKNKR